MLGKVKKKDLILLVTNLSNKISDCSKAKEHYELFLKNKGKNLSKESKAVKNPNNINKKSSTIRHPKTVSNFLKSITRSNILSQESETVEKPNIFYVESVNLEPPKTATKLSNPIRKTKLTT